MTDDDLLALLYENHEHLSDDEYVDQIRQLRARPDPIVFDSVRNRWLVVHAGAASKVLTDARLGNDLASAGPATDSGRLHARLQPTPASLLFTDGVRHRRHRLAYTGTLGRSAVDATEAAMAQPWAVVTQHLASGAREVSATVHRAILQCCFEQLGLSSTDGEDQFIEDLFAINRLFDPRLSDEERAESDSALARTQRTVERSLHGSELLQRLEAASVPAGEATSTITFMLRAGVVTLGSVVLELVRRPPVDGETMDDLLARATPSLDTGRVAHETIEIDGLTIDRGATVIVVLKGDGPDDAVDNGGRSRPDLVFGAGRHRCLGEYLVRSLLREAVEAVSTARLEGRRVAFERHCTPSFRGYRHMWLDPVE